MGRRYRDDVRFQFTDCCSWIHGQVKEFSKGKLFVQPHDIASDSPQVTTFYLLSIHSRDAFAGTCFAMFNFVVVEMASSPTSTATDICSLFFPTRVLTQLVFCLSVTRTSTSVLFEQHKCAATQTRIGLSSLLGLSPSSISIAARSFCFYVGNVI
jgi:hypothetical protein